MACAGCGKHLYGDIGRYRHPSPTCEAVLAAATTVPWDARAADRYGVLRASLRLAGTPIGDFDEMIAARAAAKQARNFDEADRIRQQLAAMGVQLKDSVQGTTWVKA